jgi:hypothetical protein
MTTEAVQLITEAATACFVTAAVCWTLFRTFKLIADRERELNSADTGESEE